MLKSLTVAEFDELVALPEHAHKHFEYIGGEIVEVPSNPYVSEIASLINFFIRLFMRENDVAGHVTGEAGGYMVAGERYAPDVAFISADKQPELAKQGYNLLPPDLAVEIISDPTNAVEQHHLRIKINNYVFAGVLVWVVNPDERRVEVYKNGSPVQVIREHEVLDGDDVLPGFKLTVSDIFPD